MNYSCIYFFKSHTLYTVLYFIRHSYVWGKTDENLEQLCALSMKRLQKWSPVWNAIQLFPHRPACFCFCVTMQYRLNTCFSTLAHLMVKTLFTICTDIDLIVVMCQSLLQVDDQIHLSLSCLPPEDTADKQGSTAWSSSQIIFFQPVPLKKCRFSIIRLHWCI